MSSQSEALIILSTWVILLGLFILNRYLIKDRLLSKSSLIVLPTEADLDHKPGTMLTRVGVLFVFIVNFSAFGVVFAAALSPEIDQNASLLKVDFPLWVSLVGCILFLLDQLWGFWALVYNPGYTPLTSRVKNQFFLATGGPYGVIRHPRYASEAMLNIVLFLFTGLWLPLLGIIGWAAIYYQACAEEEFLITITGDIYRQYQQETGRFFPKIDL